MLKGYQLITRYPCNADGPESFGSDSHTFESDKKSGYRSIIYQTQIQIASEYDIRSKSNSDFGSRQDCRERSTLVSAVRPVVIRLSEFDVGG